MKNKFFIKLDKIVAIYKERRLIYLDNGSVIKIEHTLEGTEILNKLLNDVDKYVGSMRY